jgi:hypothetical protein
MNKADWLASRCPNEAPEELGSVGRSIGRLEHCATNDAAHFGGPHGMFVDVPVRDLLAALNTRKDAIAFLRSMFPLVTPSSRFEDSDRCPYRRELTCGQIREIASFLDGQK